MPSVISNSSPLISLSAIQRLDLLRDFFGAVVVPPAVWREVVEEGQGRAGAADFRLEDGLYRQALISVGESPS
jgi:hypothetical protein